MKAPGHGFVGVGRVKGPPEPAPDFKVMADDGREQSALDVLNSATYHREFADMPEKMEYFVPVDWLETVPLDKARQRDRSFWESEHSLRSPDAEMATYDRAAEVGVPAPRRLGIAEEPRR